MKHCLPLLILALGVSADTTPVFPEKHRCTVDAAREIRLATDGVPNVEIVVGKTPYPVAVAAAEELRVFLEKAIGGRA